MASKALHTVFRGLELLWALLVMALIGNMIATAYAGNPSIVNYSMFVSVFSMLSLFYLIPATIKDGLGIPIATIALELLNVVFYFCAAVALAAYLGAHSCSNSGYTHSNFITNGSRDTEKRCHEAQASTAFLWFGFACFCATAFFSWQQSRGSVNMRGSRGAPSMSQV
ncbi:putative non-classical export protein [Diplodia seriata]|uniref:Putative non-classical export protein n=1 Tax=Diplodia seriata TaxID=420778 RepID=A0A0G2GGQ1_9PEZI|nr:putative non-classical export protein [Diplodia seriata]